MKYVRMPIEIESPEQMGYANLKCNLTESSVTDARLQDLDLNLNELVICYGDHLGHPGLRQLIAAESNAAGAGSGRLPMGPDDVLVTAGAATALFIVATTLLDAGDSLVVMRPNYATNIATPLAIGADVSFLELDFDEGWRIDLDKLDRLITPRTRLLSITTPHNPTGTTMSAEQLSKILELVEARGCYLLCDETYREMAFDRPLPVAATLSASAISVSSLSKTYGLPGIRIGWLSTRDRALQERFLAAKEQIMVTNSVVDEEIAYRFLKKKGKFLPATFQMIRTHFGIVKEWMAQQSALEWVEPSGGVVCFPRIRYDSGVDVERFYKILNSQHGTFVGPGHWFEMERRYMRIGYGWPSTDELKSGLANVAAALAASRP